MGRAARRGGARPHSCSSAALGSPRRMVYFPQRPSCGFSRLSRRMDLRLPLAGSLSVPTCASRVSFLVGLHALPADEALPGETSSLRLRVAKEGLAGAPVGCVDDRAALDRPEVRRWFRCALQIGRAGLGPCEVAVAKTRRVVGEMAWYLPDDNDELQSNTGQTLAALGWAGGAY